MSYMEITLLCIVVYLWAIGAAVLILLAIYHEDKCPRWVFIFWPIVIPVYWAAGAIVGLVENRK